MIDPADSSQVFCELDADDESWMERIRLAEAPLTLGRMGAYELLAEISRGGQGIVYRARQPGTRRDVALKRLLAGSFATPTMRRRFEREVEAAAALNHRNIVTVYSSDVVDDQPLLTMEWIDGVPVTAWSTAGPDGRPRPRAQRVRMFRAICEAVRHAHQRGVLHRDLKPSNILVDAEDQPHVLDFGLAKWTSARDGDEGLEATLQFVGTVAYAAPEQLLGPTGEVDVRSDIYSLGIMFYEMLCGRRPYDLGRNLPEAFRIIQECDAPRPSRWDPDIAGDLEAITLKMLEKDPERRYQSLDALIEDLQRYERGEAVQAHPPSAAYHLRKFVRRHRLACAFAATVMLLVMGFAVTAGMLWQDAASARDEEHAAKLSAEQAQAVAERTAGFLIDMLSAADPFSDGADAVTVRQVLDRAAVQIDTLPTDEVRAALHHTIGKSYLGLGLYDVAEQQIREALELRRALHDGDHADIAATLNTLGDCLTRAGQLEQARAVLVQALQMNRRLWNAPDPEIAATLFQWGKLELAGGHYAAAESLLQESLEQRRQTLGAVSEEVADSLNYLGEVLYGLGNLDRAENTLQEALDIGLKARSADHPENLTIRNNLAALLYKQQDFEAAGTQFTALLDSHRRVLGPRHPLVATLLNNLGMLEQQAGNLDAAETHLREALQLSRELLGEEHPTVAMRLHNLAKVLRDQARFTGAELLIREALDIRRRVLGQEHRHTAQSLHTLGEILLLQEQAEAAETVLADALRMRRAVLTANHWHTAYTLAMHGRSLTALQRFDAAERELLEAYHQLQAEQGEALERSEDVRSWLIELYDQSGRPQQAEAYRTWLPD